MLLYSKKNHQNSFMLNVSDEWEAYTSCDVCFRTYFAYDEWNAGKYPSQLMMKLEKNLKKLWNQKIIV
jgi:hypothetical protein